jgi:hydroxymethylpyrimidine/phosphomethylpyrimidine kinase
VRRRAGTGLTAGGFDPSSGAGVSLDLMVFRHFGMHGVAAVTALTVQNSSSVREFDPVAPEFLGSQLEILEDDFKISAVKIGMIGTAGNARVLARFLEHTGCVSVLDPVLSASAGGTLSLRGLREAMLDGLIQAAGVITPNIPEAEELTGCGIASVRDSEAAALRFARMGARAVVLKGGHLKGEPVDVIWDGRRIHLASGRRLSADAHGTGCAFSTALAAILSKGASLVEAARESKRFVALAIRGSVKQGKGRRILLPPVYLKRRRITS